MAWEEASEQTEKYIVTDRKAGVRVGVGEVYGVRLRVTFH